MPLVLHDDGALLGRRVEIEMRADELAVPFIPLQPRRSSVHAHEPAARADVALERVHLRPVEDVGAGVVEKHDGLVAGEGGGGECGLGVFRGVGGEDTGAGAEIAEGGYGCGDAVVAIAGCFAEEQDPEGLRGCCCRHGASYG